MTIPTQLTDEQLVEALKHCARHERHATASLVAHLAEMDARDIHLREGFPSLFAYCRQVLALSESAAYKRIEVARAARRIPAILEGLADGTLSLSTARLLAPHLTPDNQAELIAIAAGSGKRAVEELIALRFPRPDVAPLVRKLPTARVGEPGPAVISAVPFERGTSPVPSEPASSPVPRARAAASAQPLSIPLAADRYQIRFTASAATWSKLCTARELLRHTVPSGDPGEIVDRALTALIAEIARKKCGEAKTAARSPRPSASSSRHVPAAVKRAVWVRDRGRCAYVSRGGRRCGETGFLEFHHVRPFAVGGPATLANIELRCRAHNAYESRVFFAGPGASSREEGAPSATGRAG
jgi:hypothetical protein